MDATSRKLSGQEPVKPPDPAPYKWRTSFVPAHAPCCPVGLFLFADHVVACAGGAGVGTAVCPSHQAVLERVRCGVPAYTRAQPPPTPYIPAAGGSPARISMTTDSFRAALTCAASSAAAAAVSALRAASSWVGGGAAAAAAVEAPAPAGAAEMPPLSGTVRAVKGGGTAGWDVVPLAWTEGVAGGPPLREWREGGRFRWDPRGEPVAHRRQANNFARWQVVMAGEEGGGGAGAACASACACACTVLPSSPPLRDDARGWGAGPLGAAR